MLPLKHPYRSQAAASGFFAASTRSFQEIEDRLRGALARDEITTKQQGDLFEVFCEAILRLHHVFAAADVWPTGCVPSEHLAALNIRSSDRGIDGLFMTNDGKLVAYQAKFRSDGGSLTWTELAPFIGLSERAHGRLVVTNARGISVDASGRRDVTSLLGHELRALPEDMIRRACALIAGAEASPIVRFAPREHQRMAIDHATVALEAAARCTLIMACGSGKTLTALWIAERLGAGKTQARILLLLPSLALIRQMLEEWSVQQPWGDVFRFCCVCSDNSVVERDEVIVRQEDVPFPVTTLRSGAGTASQDQQGAPPASHLLRFPRRGRRHEQWLGTKAAALRDPAKGHQWLPRHVGGSSRGRCTNHNRHRAPQSRKSLRSDPRHPGLTVSANPPRLRE